MKKVVLALLVICGFGSVMMVCPAIAKNPWINNSEFCNNDNLSDEYKKEIGCDVNAEADTVVTNIINIIIAMVAAIAILMIVIGGINLASSAGDPTRAKKGRETILYSVIGLVVAMMAFALVNFVLKGALQ